MAAVGLERHRLKAGAGEQSPQNSQQSAGSFRVRSPAVRPCSLFSFPAFQREMVFVPTFSAPAEVAWWSPKCFSPLEKRRRLKGQDLRTVMGTEPTPGQTQLPTGGRPLLQTFVTNERVSGLPNRRAEAGLLCAGCVTCPSPARRHTGCVGGVTLSLSPAVLKESVIRNDSNSE